MTGRNKRVESYSVSNSMADMVDKFADDTGMPKSSLVDYALRFYAANFTSPPNTPITQSQMKPLTGWDTNVLRAPPKRVDDVLKEYMAEKNINKKQLLDELAEYMKKEE
jgi:hypothetical protein